MIRPVRLKYEDLEGFPNDGIRRELVGGELLMTPAPSPRHQDVVGTIFVTLKAYADQHGGHAYVAPIDIVFEPHDVLEPDVVYIAADRLSIIGERAIFGVPSLVVEVISPSTSHDDHTVKLEIYARYGVPEYWIVDPATRSLERYSSPAGGHYSASETFAGIAHSATLDGLTINLSEL
jgi:Uma2 family endonuclease